MNFNIKYFNSITSTNDKAMELLLLGCDEGTVAVAHSQTSGRGQQGASWESEAGKNLTFSIALRPKFLQAEHMFYLSKVVSLGVTDFLQLEGINAAIKWPNDIYIGNKKICGILIEQSISGEYIAHSVAGIGVNVNQLKFNHAPNATSMTLCDGRKRELESSLKELVTCIFKRYEQLKKACDNNANLAQIDKDYSSLLYRRDGLFPYSANEEKFKAKLVGVEPSGELVLQKESGEECRFWFKEIEFIV